MGAIVVTGSTRGIGFGLADAFLARGCSVVVCGRSEPAVDEAVTRLAERHCAGCSARGGKLFNMEGWGSRGEWSSGLTPYCTTKRALRYFTDALAREVRGEPVQVGTLSPGMVATDLLVSSWYRGAPENWRNMRRLFHFVIDPPGPVCAYLADRVLRNHKSGAHYTWMTPSRLIRRFFQPRYWRRRVVAGTALENLGG